MWNLVTNDNDVPWMCNYNKYEYNDWRLITLIQINMVNANKFHKYELTTVVIYVNITKYYI